MKFGFFLSILALNSVCLAQTPEILKHPGKIQITEIEILNSNLRETNLSISPDGKYLFYMSDRGGQPWSNQFLTFKGKPRYDGDIWYGKSTSGQWGKANCLNYGVNTSHGEDEPMISQDGQFVTYQSWKRDWQTTGGPYYTVELSGDEFKNPQGLGGGIHAFLKDEFNKAGGTYATDGAALSPDGKLFLLCCGPNYDKDMDVYISRKVNGEWTYMTKAGISTPGDERSIFIAGDNQTIYFGSDGYANSKGMDIYKTVIREDDTFEPPVNIGAPFNGPQDDYGFIITASGNESYFVRDGDIYFANTKDADPRLKPQATLLISGIMTNQNGHPAELKLTLQNPTTGEIISSSKSNSRSGEFLFSTSHLLDTYRIVSNDPNALDTIIVIEPAQSYQAIHLDLNAFIKSENSSQTLSKPQKNFVLNYENDRYRIESQYMKNLNQILNYLKANPDAKIQIQSHTSASASNDYNMKLSERRKQEVINYFRNNGISNDRMVSKAHGENKLLNRCEDSEMCDEQSQRENRRTEITIVEN